MVIASSRNLTLTYLFFPGFMIEDQGRRKSKGRWSSSSSWNSSFRNFADPLSLKRSSSVSLASSAMWYLKAYQASVNEAEHMDISLTFKDLILSRLNANGCLLNPL
jgi:hypothetical protein